jgi:chitin-binding protein
MDNPVSRSYLCYQEGPESPTSEVCRAVVAAGGTQPLYDWNEVNIADAAGRHQQLIPDGRLCSAGRDKYSGLDLARSDWPTTTLPEGGSFTFTFRATAPHAGGFELYVTKDGYDPNQPLRWSDLEAAPFHAESDPRLVDGSYVMDVALPNKQGRHLIYAIWQRTDSPEAFYACSDVVFGADGGTSSAAPPPAPAPDPEEDTEGEASGGGDDECHEGHDGEPAGTEDDEAAGKSDRAERQQSHHHHGHGKRGKGSGAARDDLAAAAATDDANGGAIQPAIAGIATRSSPPPGVPLPTLAPKPPISWTS